MAKNNQDIANPKTKPKQCGLAFSAALLHPKYWLSWIIFFFLFILAQLPTSIRHKFGRFIGNYIFKYNKKRRHIVKTNLNIAFPDLSDKERNQLAQKSLQWYACAMVDYGLIFFAEKNRLRKMLQIDGIEHINNALKSNESIILLLAHSAMLEFSPAALGYQFNIFGSYKTSKNALLDWMIARGRCRFVNFVVSRDEGLRKLIKSSAPGWLMIFLPDEDLGIENAVFTPFFGKDKATLTTTARITKLTKATALPIFSWYDSESNKYRTQILPALENYPSGDATTDAKSLNEALEKLIRQHPEQYMWHMKWFRTQPDNKPNIYQ